MAGREGRPRRSDKRLTGSGARKTRSKEPARTPALLAEAHAGEEQYRLMFEMASDAIFSYAPDLTILSLSPSVKRGLGYSPDELVGRRLPDLDIIAPESRESMVSDAMRVLAGNRIAPAEYVFIARDGTRRFGEVTGAPLFSRNGKVVGAVCVARDVTDRRRLEAALRQALDETEMRVRERTAELEKANAGLRAEIAERRRAVEALQESEERFRTVADFAHDWVYWYGPDKRFVYVSPSCERVTGYRPQEFHDDPILLTRIVHPDDRERWEEHKSRVWESDEIAVMDFRINHREGGERWVEHVCGPVYDASGQVLGRRASNLDITGRKRTEEALVHRTRELAALNRVGLALSRLAKPGEILETIYSAAGQVLDNRNLFIALYDRESQIISFPVYAIDGERRSRGSRPFGNGATEYVIRTRSPLLLPCQVTAGLAERGIDIIGREARSFLGVPMLTADRVVGVICVQDYERENVYDDRHSQLLSTFASQAAIALENARLFEDAARRLERLETLRDIETAITGSLDPGVTLGIFLDRVVAQLRADAAGVLLLNRHTHTLEYATSRGFRTAALRHTRLPLGEGYAGRAVLDRRIVSVADLAEAPGDFTRAPLLADEGFVAYHAVPLIVKGQPKGVLEVFHRSPLTPDREWLGFLETLAHHAAIAIDNAEMFADLQRSKAELLLAYDATLEGWSHALEMRDRETEGHTERVTEITLRLARAMGIGEEALAHVRRGALLHDIGKIAIPDTILLKPGPLTDEEWAVVRKHPVWAQEMLSPIAFLRPALEIPYCHHENWDGTGYPRGLKGEEIPLAARIFAVVDSWDALCSERPYRRAWSREKAREYIREQAGKRFDPEVVEVFLRMTGDAQGSG